MDFKASELKLVKKNITEFMSADHQNCDQAFVDFENIIHDGNWFEISKCWSIFANKLAFHFAMEETELFPAFDKATGMSSGPTMVMRNEHQQMRSLVAAMEQALLDKNQQDCSGIAETLMMMMQQHNMKEEQMLYPMSDQHVDSDSVIDKMLALK